MPALAGRAAASTTQESILQDDRVLYSKGPAAQARALDAMAALGVDTVHTLVHWRAIAPEADAARQPRGFDADDPRAYPSDRWNPVDDLVRGARARGMNVLMTPTSLVPRWAEGCTSAEREKAPPGTCRPSVAKFRDFVEALARRYSGRYSDETGEGRLPKVDRWSFWNEPNQGGWLSPQTRRVSGRTVIASAVHYRSLLRAGVAGLRAGGHRGGQVLLGETAPIGGSSSRTGPVRFYETLLCADSRGRRLRGTAARAAGCSGKQRRLPVTGIAHHPYTRAAGESLYKRQAATSITIAQTAKLRRLATIGARTGLLPRGLDRRIYFTEFGVSSNPPATRMAVPLATQAEWINQADYIAYRDRTVRSVAQFGLEDDTSFGRNTFQTGLCFPNGDDPCFPKPAWDAYRLPIYVLDRGRNVLVFGQVRPLRGSARASVQIQNRADSSQPWRTVQTVETGAAGYLLRTLPAEDGEWRLAWTPNLATTLFSRTALPRSR